MNSTADLMLDKPKGVYVARKRCGCVVGLVTDLAVSKKETAKAVAQFIREGLYVTHVDWDVYTLTICKEPTFMACPHEKEPLQAKLPL